MQGGAGTVQSMNVNEQAAELLEAAADGFESGEYQWIQGTYSRAVKVNDAYELGYCSIGLLQYLGIRLGQGIGQGIGQGYPRATIALGEHVLAISGVDHPAPQLFVPAWNDRAGRTKDEVIDAFKHAAKNLRNQETQ